MALRNKSRVRWEYDTESGSMSAGLTASGFFVLLYGEDDALEGLEAFVERRA